MSRSTPTFDTASLVEDVSLKRIAQYFGVLVFLAFFLAPLEAGLVTAIKTQGAVARTLPFLPPLGEGLTLENLQFAFERLSGSFLNSLLMAIPATIVNADAAAAPVTLVIPSIGASTSGINYGVRMSAALLAALPTIIIYIAFAEQFARGLRTESG